MNKLFAIGRLIADPEVKDVKETKLCAFVLAVPKTKEETDFFRCVAWGKTAEIIGKYLKKGSKIGIEGSLHTRTYETKDKQTAYTWEILVDGIDFMDSKPAASKEEKKEESSGDAPTSASKEEKKEESSGDAPPFDFPV